jgi:hypothetical protein
MSRRPPTLLLAALAAAAALGLAGCGSVGGSAHAADASSAPIGTDSATPAPGTPAPAGGNGSSAGGSSAGGSSSSGGGSSTGGGSSSSGGSSSGGSSSGGGGGGQAPAPAGKVTSLRVTQQPTCPIKGTPDAPFSKPGTDVKISWTVTGASGAAVAVDNPGVYGAYGASYPASGSLTLAFPCNDTGTTKHTYTVWPVGVHDAPKSITASASAGG